MSWWSSSTIVAAGGRVAACMPLSAMQTGITHAQTLTRHMLTSARKRATRVLMTSQGSTVSQKGEEG